MLYKRIRWLTAVVLASASFTAFGQAYPAKPVRIMVGANAGGATPAHGTAYDIAGKGLANQGAMRNAFALAARMGATRQARGA